jgi:Fe-S cluster assembly scaffold IscU
MLAGVFTRGSGLGSLFQGIGKCLYHQNVVQEFAKPRHVGTMDAKDEDVGTGIVGAPACGDVMKLQIRVDPGSQKIVDVKFKAFGCPAAISSASLATTMCEGKTVEEALEIKNTVIAKKLNLPPVKNHCSMLAQDAIRAAVEDYVQKHPKEGK